MTRPLIFGTSYCSTQPARYTLTLWLDLVTKLNPDADILIVDSASPDLPDAPGAQVLQLGDNIGHLTRTGRDGWGRAFCAGLRAAVDGNYDWAVHIETDLLFARPVAPTLAKMARAGVQIAAPMAYPHQFMETALMFMSVDYIRRERVIERYDWERAVPEEWAEIRLERLIRDDLFTLPFRGLRNDLRHVTARNMRTVFPDGCDWITHADPDVQRAFMKGHGYG